MSVFSVIIVMCSVINSGILFVCLRKKLPCKKYKVIFCFAYWVNNEYSLKYYSDHSPDIQQCRKEAFYSLLQV